MPNPIREGVTRSLFLLCLYLMLAACDSRNKPIPVSENELSPTQFTPSPVLSPTPVFTPTRSPTPTPTGTATLTPPPTLSLQMRDAELRQLIIDNVGCQPPCFMGIVPEQTTLGELNNFFIRYGLHPYDFHRRVFEVNYEMNDEIPPDTRFYIQNGVVKSIKVRLIQSHAFEWALYSPARVLNDLGAPSKVTFGLQVIHEPSPNPLQGWYRMTFYYDDLDLIIHYGDAEIKLGELITVCPNRDSFSDSASLWLGKSPDDPPRSSLDGPLEEVTPFTPESFKDFLLLGPGACFDLKASAIPIY